MSIVKENKCPICCNCAYCGDKYSFPSPNDKIKTDPNNPLIKYYYCCCGDCKFYEKNVTSLNIQICDFFEEL